MDLQRELRRSRNSLYQCGNGAIGLGLWAVIKAVMSFSADREIIRSIIRDSYANSGITESEVDVHIVALIAYFFVLFFLILIFSIRLYVGRCAYGEARQGRKRVFYLIIALAVGLIYIYSSYYTIVEISELTFNETTMVKDLENANDKIATLFLDITSAIVMLALFFSAIRSRILLILIKRQEAAHEH